MGHHFFYLLVKFYVYYHFLVVRLRIYFQNLETPHSNTRYLLHFVILRK
jgi:hypothetical protein